MAILYELKYTLHHFIRNHDSLDSISTSIQILIKIRNKLLNLNYILQIYLSSLEDCDEVVAILLKKNGMTRLLISIT